MSQNKSPMHKDLSDSQIIAAETGERIEMGDKVQVGGLEGEALWDAKEGAVVKIVITSKVTHNP